MPSKSPEELQAIIDGMNAKIATLEAKAQQTEVHYKAEKKELEQDIHLLRASAGNGMGAMGMPMMGMGGMPMGMGGMGMGAPMMGMGMPPMPGQDQAHMQMMQMMMSMAHANPAMMPQCMQMMQMMLGMCPQPAAGTTPMPFAFSAAPAAPAPAPAPSAARVSSVTSSSRPAASLSVSAPGATLEGGSTVAQLRALQAEKDKLASRSVSASNRADSASKIASIKASALVKQETAVELCILMDCTGSMGQYIEQAKQKAAVIVEQAREKYAVDLRVAFVGYRDFGDPVRFEVKDFVAGESIDEVTQLLMRCTATGGGDAPEDVAGGLEKALHLSWSQSSSRIKMIVHVADAPAHGSEYHDGLGDNHNGVQNPDPAEMMRQLGDKKVAYYFFKINDSTDKMIAKLKEAHKNSRREFKVHELGSDAFKFADIVLGSIASSVRAAGIALPTPSAPASPATSSSASASFSRSSASSSMAAGGGGASATFSPSHY